jgi:hypothetical protein
MLLIMWYVNPFLGNNREISNYTTVRSDIGSPFGEAGEN